MRLSERRYAEMVKGSAPIAREQLADWQPENENCVNGVVLQPNTTADGSRKVTIPVVVSMTKVLFEHYRLQMYSYLNHSLRNGQLESIIGFPFANHIITRDVCAFRSVNYWRIDRINFWADVSVSLRLSTEDGTREWRGYLCFWFSAAFSCAGAHDSDGAHSRQRRTELCGQEPDPALQL